MLAKIFGSNARVKILKTFLSKPEQKYYARQLAHDLELQINSVRRELDNLKNIGLIKEQLDDDAVIINEDLVKKVKKNSKKPSKTSLKKETTKNEIKYFIADKDFLLFHELKSLFAKANLLSCQDFLKNINNLGEINHLWLSGIFTGDINAPVDILIVGKINKSKLLERIKNLENDLAKEINFTIMDNSEYEYRRDINDIFLHRLNQCQTLHEINKEKEVDK